MRPASLAKASTADARHRNWMRSSERQIEAHEQKFSFEILDRKRKVVARLRPDPASRRLSRARSGDSKERRAASLRRALESDSPQLKIIAEFKRRSPSAGIIRDDLSVSEIVRCYERGGACAISVLTDEEYFAGSIADLCAARSNTQVAALAQRFHH